MPDNTSINKHEASDHEDQKQASASCLVGMIPLEQKQSAFFSKLPPELRVQIASFLLCSKNDEGFVALTLDGSLFPSKSGAQKRKWSED